MQESRRAGDRALGLTLTLTRTLTLTLTLTPALTRTLVQALPLTLPRQPTTGVRPRARALPTTTAPSHCASARPSAGVR